MGRQLSEAHLERGYYPPELTKLRGSHPGSFKIAHVVRDGKTFDNATDDTDEWD
jgi:spermidine dehydrogenase